MLVARIWWRSARWQTIWWQTSWGICWRLGFNWIWCSTSLMTKWSQMLHKLGLGIQHDVTFVTSVLSLNISMVLDLNCMWAPPSENYYEIHILWIFTTLGPVPGWLLSTNPSSIILCLVEFKCCFSWALELTFSLQTEQYKLPPSKVYFNRRFWWTRGLTLYILDFEPVSCSIQSGNGFGNLITNNGLGPRPFDIVSNIIYWTVLNDIVQYYLKLLNI